jgi:4-methylaminobutanoate oxidase (formaldehyde-forming)
VTFTIADPAVVLAGRETIRRDGRPVGYLASAGWGYTVGANIGLGYVRNRDGVTDGWLKSGTYALEVATERVPAVLHFDPLYDPANARVRA